MAAGVIIDPLGQSVVVTITSATSGRVLSLFSDRNATAPVSNPITISVATKLYVNESITGNVSLKVNGVEQATATGAPATVLFTDGGVGSVTLYPNFFAPLNNEIAYAENITGTNLTSTDSSGTPSDMTGLSVVVPASVAPVYVELHATFGHTAAGAVCLAWITEVSNGVDTAKQKLTAFTIAGATGLFTVQHQLRVPPTPRTRTFKAQMGTFTAGTLSCNVGTGTNAFDYECSLRAIVR